MSIQPFSSLLPGAETAILYLHGILSTPDYFRPFFPMVHHCSQYSIALDGHGGSPIDFARSSMDQWKTQVEEAIQMLLSSHQRLILVAHSMGTLFAISSSIRHPKRICSLLLLNPPLRVEIRWSLFWHSWNILRGNVSLKSPPQLLAAQQAYSITPDLHLWRYLGWIPRYFELFQEIKQVRGELASLSCPCVIFLSDQDEMVSSHIEDLLAPAPHVALHHLTTSTHFYYSPPDKNQIMDTFSSLLSRWDHGRCKLSFPFFPPV